MVGIAWTGRLYYTIFLVGKSGSSRGLLGPLKYIKGMAIGLLE